jgi:hypothetical protein
MIKTQVQVPDELYRKAKALAKAKEWSLAEVFRRGLEYITTVNDPDRVEKNWKLPVLKEEQFVDGFDDLDLKALVAEEMERGL